MVALGRWVAIAISVLLLVTSSTGNSEICIKTCHGRADGAYPSCHGCQVFVICFGGQLYNDVPCPTDQSFNANQRRCLKGSTVCLINRTRNTGPGPRNLHKTIPQPNHNESIVQYKNKDQVGEQKRGGNHTIAHERMKLVRSGECVTSCKAVADGNYQSCDGCYVFATCVNGSLYDSQPCTPPTIWDDRIKQCSSTSSTCRDSPGTCVASCDHVQAGQYQSCLGCHLFITCPEFSESACAEGLVWDDDKKKCVKRSSTCNYGHRKRKPPDGEQSPITLTGNNIVSENENIQEMNSSVSVNGSSSQHQTSCISSCDSMPDGAYQSCWGCHIYTTCTAGSLKVHGCPSAGQSWDNNRKNCVPISATCGPGFGGCVRNCGTLHDGDYQSCDGCHVHVTCSRGVLHSARPCPIGLVWDDLIKWCVKTSTTCKNPGSPAASACILSCEGHLDGHYQSCQDCSVYASCLNGSLVDGLPCPGNFKFDAIERLCLKSSRTCPTRAENKISFEPGGFDGRTNNSEGNFTWIGHVGDGVCVSSCAAQQNGDYQSCQGCNMFASCLNSVLYDRRPCPDGLIWEDTIKHCRQNSSTCGPGRGGCVSSCINIADGEYQSCKGCNVYVSCQNGIMEDARPCPNDQLWDDNVKRCGDMSVTCPERDARGVPAGVCIASCEGRVDGDYQSCLGCTGYVTCTGGTLHDNRPCPTGLVWDDTRRRCRYKSLTCYPGRGMCTRSCQGLPDGDYQSCIGCNIYATCSDNVLHDSRPCPSGLLWDDSIKRCMRTSLTCHNGHSSRRQQNRMVDIAHYHGSSVQAVTRLGCVTTCDGLSNGNYQSCNDCRVYVTCHEGIASDDRPCPANTLWDDQQKRCLRTSATCTSVIVVGGQRRFGGWGNGGYNQGPPTAHEDNRRQPSRPQERSTANGRCIHSCVGRDNGDYQSCIDCRMFATCLHGVLHDARPCPRTTVWDDIHKRCMYESLTCHLPGHHPQSQQRNTPRSATRAQSTPQSSARSLPTPISCTSSCIGLADGNYQSCHDCRLYATCQAGVLNDHRPCPRNTFWDNHQKRCVRFSSTCTNYHPAGHNSQTGQPHCITSCRGVADGDYHSCKGCNIYASCIRGNFFDGRKCPSGLVWDDDRKQCDYTSTSCIAAAARRLQTHRCIDSCAGMPDGKYQSCLGCNLFATCKSGALEGSQPCKGNLVWDDNLKRCLWRSITCRQ